MSAAGTRIWHIQAIAASVTAASTAHELAMAQRFASALTCRAPHLLALKAHTDPVNSQHTEVRWHPQNLLRRKMTEILEEEGWTRTETDAGSIFKQPQAGLGLYVDDGMVAGRKEILFPRPDQAFEEGEDQGDHPSRELSWDRLYAGGP